MYLLGCTPRSQRAGIHAAMFAADIEKRLRWSVMNEQMLRRTAVGSEQEWARAGREARVRHRSRRQKRKGTHVNCFRPPRSSLLTHPHPPSPHTHPPPCCRTELRRVRRVSLNDPRASWIFQSPSRSVNTSSSLPSASNLLPYLFRSASLGRLRVRHSCADQGP